MTPTAVKSDALGQLSGITQPLTMLRSRYSMWRRPLNRAARRVRQYPTGIMQSDRHPDASNALGSASASQKHACRPGLGRSPMKRFVEPQEVRLVGTRFNNDNILANDRGQHASRRRERVRPRADRLTYLCVGHSRRARRAIRRPAHRRFSAVVGPTGGAMAPPLPAPLHMLARDEINMKLPTKFNLILPVLFAPGGWLIRTWPTPSSSTCAGK